MSMKERLHTGELYLPDDPEIVSLQQECLERLYEYNATRPHESEKRAALLQEMFAQIGEGCYIEPPLRSNWGGYHVHFGNHVYANFNLTLVDDTHIYVGDHTMIGPNVTIATAGHPLLPELREKNYQYNMPVHIGRNCWIGAGAIILPGVTIGDHTVVGAGNIVTKDLPSSIVAVGNPCHVLRPIGAHDREYYFREHRIDPSFLDYSDAAEPPVQ
ncbi:MAG TPA: sugar O-acetyltransferase [Candidatus Faecimorpha stercoravium]|nr:sugar O-acetyltransferase [Candidatus Faecimorpha stercoravium]